jgi:hypothetical protein
MGEDEILEEIAIYTALIKQVPQIGQKYEVGTGQSKRIFENIDLKLAISHRRDLYKQLDDLSGCSGIVAGY